MIIYGPRKKLFGFGRILAQGVVDKQGQVRNIHSIRDMPPVAELVQILDRLNGETGRTAA
jgi:hypothetical protein